MGEWANNICQWGKEFFIVLSISSGIAYICNLLLPRDSMCETSYTAGRW